MPWKVSSKVEERKKFVARILNGDKMTDVCQEFEISRKTGYKIYNRYLELGKLGLEDVSQRPKRLANLLDSGVASVILDLKRSKPTWGAPKLRELFLRRYSNLKPPAISTIHALLDRNGLVKNRALKSRYRAIGTSLSNPVRPNDLWCTDFKGQFHLVNRNLCYPLTVTDQVSRFIVAIEAMEKISETECILAFKRIFQEYGLPEAIRSDNGVPFSSRGLFGLSKLAVFWLRLGIKLERIVPGNPQQNGRHERMHRTLKLSTTKPPANNILAQQEKFDDFLNEFNKERPHEALAMKVPADIYRKSQKACPHVLQDLEYPSHDRTLKVTSCGKIRLNNKNIFISETLAGQYLGTNQVDDGVWELAFMDFNLGFFDTESHRFTPTKNPFDLLNS